MKIWVGLLFILILIPMASAIEFTDETIFKEGEINFIFKEGVSFDSFKIISDGIIIDDSHRLVFVVAGGELDVTFYEWSPIYNQIGLKGDAAQDLTFKITVDNKKQYIKQDNDYFINSIPIDDNEIMISYVEYDAGIDEDVVVKTISKDKWHEAMFIEFEYETYTDSSGIIHSKTLGVTWVAFIIGMLGVIILVWAGSKW